MRIIGGHHRGRNILPPEGRQTTRPITDRVKQSLFDRLWSMGLVGDQSEGRRVLDIFAGTGSLGLETLSRGASHCTFVEKDRSARDRLERNLANLALTYRASVLSVDAMSAILVQQFTGPLDLIFCDPPYALTRTEETAGQVAALIASLAPLTDPGGVLVLRTHAATPPATVQDWDQPQTTRYGTMAVHLYVRPGH